LDASKTTGVPQTIAFFSNLKTRHMKSYRKTILYVDDDPDDVAMLRHALESVDSEHQMVEAYDGIRALELLHQMLQKDELPRLIILDINMPRMDGKQALVALQKEEAFTHIPVVLFSTSSSLLDKTFCELRKVALVTKPVDVTSLYITAHKLVSYCRA
jgi:CheY-like chemotaxis protein